MKKSEAESHPKLKIANLERKSQKLFRIKMGAALGIAALGTGALTYGIVDSESADVGSIYPTVRSVDEALDNLNKIPQNLRSQEIASSIDLLEGEEKALKSTQEYKMGAEEQNRYNRGNYILFGGLAAIAGGLLGVMGAVDGRIRSRRINRINEEIVSIQEHAREIETRLGIR